MLAEIAASRGRNVEDNAAKIEELERQLEQVVAQRNSARGYFNKLSRLAGFFSGKTRPQLMNDLAGDGKHSLRAASKEFSQVGLVARDAGVGDTYALMCEVEALAEDVNDRIVDKLEARRLHGKLKQHGFAAE